ncbi:MAG: RAD55 family ATPase [Candidatus Odinarchaeota archaeon]
MSDNSQPPNQQAMMAQMMGQMMQMMQTMQGAPAETILGKEVEDKGLDERIIRPATFKRMTVKQQGINVGQLFRLFIGDDGKALGLPLGITMVLSGPPFTGKTRTSTQIVSIIASMGYKVALVVSEEIYFDEDNRRNDLHSRFCTIGMAALDMTEEEFKSKVLEYVYVVPNPYHTALKEKEEENTNWERFFNVFYKPLVENEGVKFWVIDSLNALDPVNKRRSADNLNAIKTYNQENGVTCIVISQVGADGVPQGGNPLLHNAEASVHFYEKSIGSKEEAAEWNSTYRARIMVAKARSKVCKTVPHEVRMASSDSGTIVVDPDHPFNQYPVSDY